MNDAQKIAVVGAGIMGLCAAYVMSARGCNVDLYDPAGFPADNASLMAGGMLAPYAEIEHMPPAWVAMGLSGVKFWQESEFDCTASGSLLLAHDHDRYILERFKSHLPHDAFKNINAQEMIALEPSLTGRFTSGLYIPQEACLDPQYAMHAMVQVVKNHERVRVLQDAPDMCTLSETCAYVFDCRGMGAVDDLPYLRGVKGEIVTVRNLEFTLSRPVRLMHPRYPLYIVPRADHVFMIGATNVESTGEGVSVRSALELLSAAYSLHPSFGEAEILNVQAGIRPSFPDNLPRIVRDGNILRCNGLYRHGYLLAPIMAECAADLVDGLDNQFTSLLLSTGDSHEDRRQRTG